jgi:hypothetical protein
MAQMVEQQPSKHWIPEFKLQYHKNKEIKQRIIQILFLKWE